jgi:kinesin family protein 6/9
VEVSISYLEIYNNNAYDLLGQIGEGFQRLEDLRKVTIADTGKSTVFKDLTVSPARTFEDAHRMFWSGEALRQRAETVNNKYSSRSHTIFTFYFKKRTASAMVSSRINFVDLAGSEKYESLSKEVDQRKLEARHINKSLHTLQSVIIGLNQRQRHVPFRDSTLTRFLKDSLVGNVKTAMIATLSTDRTHLTETISTCRFAESVASVTTTSRLSQQDLPPQEVIARLRDEVTRLRDELSRQATSPAHPVSPDDAHDVQQQVIQFIEDADAGARLDVTDPERVQLCFRFMKQLIKQSEGSSVTVSRLRRQLEEKDKALENFIRIHNAQTPGLSKEATYLEFCNGHENRQIMQRMKDRIRERCATTKRLNDDATRLKRRQQELSADLESLEPAAAQLRGRPATDAAAARELAELAARQVRLSEEHAAARAEFERNYEELRACTDEVIRLQAELNEHRALLQQEFERFWLTISRQPGPRAPASKKPTRKATQPFYSHT